jgi:hypothetical protein
MIRVRAGSLLAILGGRPHDEVQILRTEILLAFATPQKMEPLLDGRRGTFKDPTYDKNRFPGRRHFQEMAILICGPPIVSLIIADAIHELNTSMAPSIKKAVPIQMIAAAFLSEMAGGCFIFR